MSYGLSELAKRFWPSIKYTSYVGHKLQMAGFGVILPPQRIRDENEDRRQFETTNDVFPFVEGGKKLRLEVKSKNWEFGATPDTWPTILSDVLLCKATKRSDPYAICLVSQQTKDVLCVINDGTWFERLQGDPDPARNVQPYMALAAPTSSLITWDELVRKVRTELLGKAPQAPEITTGV